VRLGIGRARPALPFSDLGPLASLKLMRELPRTPDVRSHIDFGLTASERSVQAAESQSNSRAEAARENALQGGRTPLEEDTPWRRTGRSCTSRNQILRSLKTCSLYRGQYLAQADIDKRYRRLCWFQRISLLSLICASARYYANHASGHERHAVIVIGSAGVP